MTFTTRRVVPGALVASLIAAGGQLAAVAPAQAAPAADNTISQAAHRYDPANPSTAAALVEAASPITQTPLTGSPGTAALASAGPVTVASDASAALSTAGTRLAVRLAATGPARSSVTSGAVVRSNALPGTDLVTRATATGAQMVAILRNAQAGRQLHFQLSMPKGATLKRMTDGSVQVLAPVTEHVVPDAEIRRVTTAVNRVLGSKPDTVALTSTERARLAAIPAAKSTVDTTKEVIAVAAPAWAVDANGHKVNTRYEVHHNTLTQVVDTTKNTVFPVTADPSWWWWAATSATCAAEVAGFLFVGYKLARTITRVQSIIRNNRALAYTIQKLGGIKATFQTIYNAAKGIASGSIRRRLSATQVKYLKEILNRGWTAVANYIGIGSCSNLIQKAV